MRLPLNGNFCYVGKEASKMTFFFDNNDNMASTCNNTATFKTNFSGGYITAKLQYSSKWSLSHFLFDSWVIKILTRFKKPVRKYPAINYLTREEIWKYSGHYFFHKFVYCRWWPYHCKPLLFIFLLILIWSFSFWLQ